MTPTEIAKSLSEGQRQCGNLLDSFPCVQCASKGPGGCPLPPSATYPMRDLLNSTRGLGNYLRGELGKARSQKENSSG